MPHFVLYLLQVFLLPDVAWYITQALYSFFLRLVTGLGQAQPVVFNDATNIPHSHHEHASSFPPSIGPDISQQEAPADSIVAVPDSMGSRIIEGASSISQSALSSASKQVSYPENPEPAQISSLRGSDAQVLPRVPSSESSQSQDLSSTPQRPKRISPQPLLSPHLSTGERTGDHVNIQNIHDSRNVFIDGDSNAVTYMNTVIHHSTMFMEKLLSYAIPGAASDSSARDPPPRCHPGTRLAVLERCLHFILNCAGKTKMLWIFGPAGVGKSAIMQSVAEYPLPSVLIRASIFFFVDGRSDVTKALATLAYQLAVQCEPYRQFIEQQIARDPSLLQKSMAAQFNIFFIEPFVNHLRLNPAGRILIIIDGLDECDSTHHQEELLRLISNFCVTYPSSTLVWLVASRPEPHITSFFGQEEVSRAYMKEEVRVDSCDTRKDVEKFLRNELFKIQQHFSFDTPSRWPLERDLWKLANASGGLFVYASTALKYIGDRGIGNPTSQLDDLLKAIDGRPFTNTPGEQHPLVPLDSLYTQILSKVPAKVIGNTRKLLLALVAGWDVRFDNAGTGRNFIVLCNWLGVSCDDAYAALRHLLSVLDVPERSKAHKKELRYFHKSFLDYLSDCSRSEFSPDASQEIQQLKVQCSLRILGQASDGIDFGEGDYHLHSSLSLGVLARGPGTGDNILLAWPVGEATEWYDRKTRLCIYKMAVASIVEGIRKGESAFCTDACIRYLTTCFKAHASANFPHHQLQNLLFDADRCHGFIKRGILKQIPVKELDLSDIKCNIEVQFRRPNVTTSAPADPWATSCVHERRGEWGESAEQNWITRFWMMPPKDIGCAFCFQRLEDQLNISKAQCPDRLVPILFTSTGRCFVEFHFVDLKDGISEWKYRFVQKFSLEERIRLGSIV